MDDEAMRPEEKPPRPWEIEEVDEEVIRQMSDLGAPCVDGPDARVGDEDWVTGLGEEVDE